MKAHRLAFFRRSFIFAHVFCKGILPHFLLYMSCSAFSGKDGPLGHSLDPAHHFATFSAAFSGFGFVDSAGDLHALPHLQGCLLQGVEHAINPTRATPGCRCEPSDSPVRPWRRIDGRIPWRGWGAPLDTRTEFISASSKV